MTSEAAIVEQFLGFGKDIDTRELFPTLETGAIDFALSDPYPLAMAPSLDKGTKVD